MAVMTLDEVGTADGSAREDAALAVNRPGTTAPRDTASAGAASAGAATRGTAGPGVPIGELVDQLSGTADRLSRAVGAGAGADGGGGTLTPTERRRLLAELDRVMAVLTSARAGVLIAEREAGTWQGSGDRSLEAWLGRTSGTGMRAAHSQMQQAETLTRMPQVRDAAQDGSISIEHVDVLSRVAARAPEPVRTAMESTDVQQELLAIARRVDAGAFARSAARLAAKLDPAAHERGHQAQRAARYLHLTDTPDGVRIKGLLDSMAGYRLRLALEAASPRPGLDEDRSSEQRRADALSVLAEAVLTSPQTTTGAAVRPHVSMHLTEETWAALREHYRQTESQGEPDGSTDAAGGDSDELDPPRGASDLTYEPATLDDGTPVPLSEVARVLCDCELTRIVIDATGAVVDLGRSQRTYAGAQRRAVVARDRTCAWPDCHGNARWAEIHHSRWWDRDTGPTSIENGVLLCSFHHHEVHRRELTITRQPRGSRVSPSSGPEPPGEARSPRDPRPPGDPRPSGDRTDDLPYVTYTFRAPDGRLVA